MDSVKEIQEMNFLKKHEFLIGIILFFVGASCWDSLPMTCTVVIMIGLLACYDADQRERE